MNDRRPTKSRAPILRAGHLAQRGRTAPMDEDQLQELEKAEQEIARGEATVRAARQRIQERELYRARGYRSFREYEALIRTQEVSLPYNAWRLAHDPLLDEVLATVDFERLGTLPRE